MVSVHTKWCNDDCPTARQLSPHGCPQQHAHAPDAIIVAENLVKYVPPDGFFGIQISQNSISARHMPRTLWGSLRRFARPLVGWRGGYPSSFPTSTPRRLTVDAKGIEARCLWPRSAPKPNFWIRPRTNKQCLMGAVGGGSRY